MGLRQVGFALVLVCLVLGASSDAWAQRNRGGGGGFGNAVRGVAGVPAVTEEGLVPSSVHTGYASLDATNPLAGTDITYTVTGIEQYDTFFLNVAKVRGSLALASHVLGLADAVLESDMINEVFSGSLFTDTLGTAVDVPMESRQAVFMALVAGNVAGARSGLGDISDDQFQAVRAGLLERYADVVTLSELLPVATQSLAALPNDVTTLANQAPGLVTDAPSAFAGPQAVNAPRVVEELGVCTTQLAQLPTDVADVAQALAALTRSE